MQGDSCHPGIGSHSPGPDGKRHPLDHARLLRSADAASDTFTASDKTAIGSRPN